MGEQLLFAVSFLNGAISRLLLLRMVSGVPALYLAERRVQGETAGIGDGTPVGAVLHTRPKGDFHPDRYHGLYPRG